MWTLLNELINYILDKELANSFTMNPSMHYSRYHNSVIHGK